MSFIISKSKVALIAIGLTLVPALVSAHGRMTCPMVRGRGLENDDPLRTPLNLRTNSFPIPGANMESCGGFTFDNGGKVVTPVTPGGSLDITWEMGYWTGAALHQGSVEISISTSGDDSNWKSLTTVSLKGDSTVAATPHGVTVTIPSDLKCPAGHCTIQFKWVSGLTPETYLNCADVVVAGQPLSYGAILAADAPADRVQSQQSHCTNTGYSSGASSSGSSSSTSSGTSSDSSSSPSSSPSSSSSAPSAGTPPPSTPSGGSSSSYCPCQQASASDSDDTSPSQTETTPSPAASPAMRYGKHKCKRGYSRS